MSRLDGFVLYNDFDKRYYITLRSKTITFCHSIVEAFGFPAYIHMFVDQKGNRIAFQPCEYDGAAIAFYKEPKKGKQFFCKITESKKVNLLIEMSGINAGKNGVRIYGKFIPDEKVMILDLKAAR